MNRSFLIPAALSALLFVGQFQTAHSAPAKPKPLPTPIKFEHGWQKTELYFGLAKPKGGNVSTRDWERFVAEVVTPRFPDGLTVVDAYGQWRDSKKKIIRENTKLVILLHPKSAQADRKVQDMIDIYKKRFGQNGVLWIHSPADVRF